MAGLVLLSAFALFVAAVVAVALAVHAFQSKQLNETYRKLARRFGGRLHEGGWFQRPSVTFHHRGNWVRVDIHSTGGKHPVHYTQVHLGWPEQGFRCEIYPEGFIQSIGKFLGMQDIEIGSPQFDRDYVITGSDRAVLRAFLNPQVQSAIGRFRAIGENRDIYVAVRNYELLIKKRGMIADLPTLEYFTGLALYLYDSALVPADHGIQFLDAPAAAPPQHPICQICGEAIAGDMVHCKSCKTPHHHDCWEYYGQCSTFGCGQRQCYRPRRQAPAH